MVSVIIPVYNTGKYLNKCLSSLCAQTYQNWECLLINDCSTDSLTNQLLEKWSKKDCRFVLIQNEKNLGIEKNRFVGLEKIRGEYLMFMDHDDWLVNDKVIEGLVSKMINYNCDIIQAVHSDSFGPYVVERKLSAPEGVVVQPDLKNKYYAAFFGLNNLPSSIWGKLYRTSIVKNADLHPYGLRYVDDSCFNMGVFPYARSMYVWHQHIYNHRWGGYSSKYQDGLSEYKKYYDIRLGAISRFNFPNGKKWLDIEIKNVLIVDLIFRIEEEKMNKKQFVEYLKNEMSDSFWAQLEKDNFNDRIDSFVSAFFDRNYYKMYDLLYDKVSSNSYRRSKCFRSIARRILRIIA